MIALGRNLFRLVLQHNAHPIATNDSSSILLQRKSSTSNTQLLSCKHAEGSCHPKEVTDRHPPRSNPFNLLVTSAAVRRAMLYIHVIIVTTQNEPLQIAVFASFWHFKHLHKTSPVIRQPIKFMVFSLCLWATTHGLLIPLLVNMVCSSRSS